MIERYSDEYLVPSEAQAKMNELIEASNRQDRAIAILMRNSMGGMEQYFPAKDHEYFMVIADEVEANGDDRG